MAIHRTYRKLIGQDIHGKHVERRIYSDDDYREYVALDKYARDDPRALVPIDYFVEHFVSSYGIRDEWHYIPGTWEPAY